MAATEWTRSATTRAKSGRDKGAGAGAVGTPSGAGAAAAASADVVTWSEAVVVGEGMVVGGELTVEGGEPDISDTRLVGTRSLPDLEVIRMEEGWTLPSTALAARRRRGVPRC